MAYRVDESEPDNSAKTETIVESSLPQQKKEGGLIEAKQIGNKL